MAPVHLEIDGKAYNLPLFTFNDWIEWAAEVDAARTETALAGSNADQRAQLMTFYNILPTDLGEMRRRLVTPEGIRRVCGTCMKRGGVPEAKIPGILAGAHTGDLLHLAHELGQLESEQHKADREFREEAERKALEAKGGGPAADPLSRSGPSGESNLSTSTGAG